ncbi:hypothetical protein SC1_00813 [Sphingopyxis sp. C-1]|nr:hypothetical protein SC1_00813 [Sphingopyxis sp. C-1]
MPGDVHADHRQLGLAALLRVRKGRMNEEHDGQGGPGSGQ